VLVVAKHRETLDGLVAYLDGAGVRCLGSSTLPADLEGASAVVLFPDDFATDAALAWIRDTERSAPPPRVVVVTRDCATFSTQAGREKPRVLPRPSFGWDILDAVRAFEPELR